MFMSLQILLNNIHELLICSRESVLKPSNKVLVVVINTNSYNCGNRLECRFDRVNSPSNFEEENQIMLVSLFLALFIAEGRTTLSLYVAT